MARAFDFQLKCDCYPSVQKLPGDILEQDAPELDLLLHDMYLEITPDERVS